MTSYGPSTRDELPAYRVLSLDKDESAEADGHSHVLGITTGDPDGGETHWTIVQVISAIRDGERFLLGGGTETQAAEIAPAVCPRCPFVTLVVNQPKPEPARTF